MQVWHLRAVCRLQMAKSGMKALDAQNSAKTVSDVGSEDTRSAPNLLERNSQSPEKGFNFADSSTGSPEMGEPPREDDIRRLANVMYETDQIKRA